MTVDFLRDWASDGGSVPEHIHDELATLGVKAQRATAGFILRELDPSCVVQPSWLGHWAETVVIDRPTGELRLVVGSSD
jgi:hypothetical protein